MSIVEIFITLVGVHFICDYVFQTDAIAQGKNRLSNKALFGVNWYYWMTSHAATHAFGVGLVTGSVYLGLLEFILHFCIDVGKCEKFYGIHADQIAHLICKVIIIYLFTL